MIFEVAIGARVRTVTVVRQGGILHVDVDGRAHFVDAERIGEAALSLLVRPGDNGLPVRSIDAAFAARPAAGDFDVHVDGRTVPLQVRQPGAFGRQKKEGAGGTGSGPQRVIAPMPGKIARVLVNAGDQVKARQGLVVIEAMKMENELRAARDGRVRDVPAVEGQSVEAGAVLVIVD